jgi:hypothetical protein
MTRGLEWRNIRSVVYVTMDSAHNDTGIIKQSKEVLIIYSRSLSLSLSRLITNIQEQQLPQCHETFVLSSTIQLVETVIF